MTIKPRETWNQPKKWYLLICTYETAIASLLETKVSIIEMIIHAFLHDHC